MYTCVGVLCFLSCRWMLSSPSHGLRCWTSSRMCMMTYPLSWYRWVLWGCGGACTCGGACKPPIRHSVVGLVLGLESWSCRHPWLIINNSTTCKCDYSRAAAAEHPSTILQRPCAAAAAAAATAKQIVLRLFKIQANYRHLLRRGLLQRLGVKAPTCGPCTFVA